jgi:hypothetical protein
MTAEVAALANQAAMIILTFSVLLLQMCPFAHRVMQYLSNAIHDWCSAAYCVVS